MIAAAGHQELQGRDRISTSFIQRQLRIGFPRAARLVDQLEQEVLSGRMREVVGVAKCSLAGDRFRRDCGAASWCGAELGSMSFAQRRGCEDDSSCLGALVGLIVAAAGVALFVWLLWWLWTRRDEQKETTAVEIGAEPPPPVGEPLAVKAEQPTLDEAKAEARAPKRRPWRMT